MAEEVKRHALDDDFESGLPDDFDGRIIEITFGYDDKIRDGEVALARVTIKSDEHEDDIEVLYPCGNGWEPAGKPKGSMLAHESGKPRRLNKNASWAQFAYHVHDAGYTEFDGNDMLTADTFAGLEFHWNRVTVDYGGEIGKKERLFPSKFLSGKKGSGGKATAKAADKGGGKAKAKYDVSEVDESIVDALKEAAAGAESYDDFVNAGLDVDGVDGNAPAEALVASKAFYDAHHEQD